MNEHDIQEIATRACDYLKIPIVRITVKGGARRGYASPKTGRASIPAWTLQLHPGYAVYYTLHELTHFKVWKHGEAFKAIEQDLCSQFGIGLKYRKVFPDAINWNDEHISCTKKDINRAAKL